MTNDARNIVGCCGHWSRFNIFYKTKGQTGNAVWGSATFGLVIGGIYALIRGDIAGVSYGVPIGAIIGMVVQTPELMSRISGRPNSTEFLPSESERLTTVISQLLCELKTATSVISEAGLLDNGGWTEEFQKKMVNVCSQHVMKVQTIHNNLADVGRSNETDELHQQALMTARGYLETLMAYAEFKRMLLTDEFMTPVRDEKQQDGIEWDEVTRDQAKILISLLERDKPQIEISRDLRTISGANDYGFGSGYVADFS
ncbi:hypothetical protein GKO46_13095 [SAR202 cluster bacterium JH702]|uniref:Uncharacterized protein n=1 Tax=Candidatus Lucifugimonas marina TaxID=3038979 RepID=A0ABD4XUA0_9CHLR|nr:hypothetical protein [SAR202 cluster bacterium JH702]